MRFLILLFCVTFAAQLFAQHKQDSMQCCKRDSSNGICCTHIQHTSTNAFSDSVSKYSFLVLQELNKKLVDENKAPGSFLNIGTTAKMWIDIVAALLGIMLVYFQIKEIRKNLKVELEGHSSTTPADKPNDYSFFITIGLGAVILYLLLQLVFSIIYIILALIFLTLFGVYVFVQYKQFVLKEKEFQEKKRKAV